MGNSSMDNKSDRDFESQGQNQGSGSSGKGQQAASSRGYGNDAGTEGDMDDDMTTAGGRKGQFSDKNRGSEGQWSPGSSGGSSDE